MVWREFFLYVSEIFTSIYLNLKEIILKGTITWSENEAKEVYSSLAVYFSFGANNSISVAKVERNNVHLDIYQVMNPYDTLQ